MLQLKTTGYSAIVLLLFCLTTSDGFLEADRKTLLRNTDIHKNDQINTRNFFGNTWQRFSEMREERRSFKEPDTKTLSIQREDRRLSSPESRDRRSVDSRQVSLSREGNRRFRENDNNREIRSINLRNIREIRLDNSRQARQVGERREIRSSVDRSREDNSRRFVNERREIRSSTDNSRFQENRRRVQLNDRRMDNNENSRRVSLKPETRQLDNSRQREDRRRDTREYEERFRTSDNFERASRQALERRETRSESDRNQDNSRRHVRMDSSRRDNTRRDVRMDNARRDIRLDNSRRGVRLDTTRRDVRMDDSRRDVRLDNSRRDVRMDNTRRDVRLDSSGQVRDELRTRSLDRARTSRDQERRLSNPDERRESRDSSRQLRQADPEIRVLNRRLTVDKISAPQMDERRLKRESRLVSDATRRITNLSSKDENNNDRRFDYSARIVAERDSRQSRHAERRMATSFRSTEDIEYIPEMKSNMLMNAMKVVLISFLVAQVVSNSSKTKKNWFHNLTNFVTVTKDKVL